MLLDVLTSIGSAITQQTSKSFELFQKQFHQFTFSDEIQYRRHRKTISHAGNYEEPREEKKLQEKKKELLKELTTIEDELRKRHVSKSRICKKIENSVDDAEAFDKANELIARMNKQRREKTEAHRKWTEDVHLKVQKSLKKFAEMNEIQQREKQEKRHMIEQRIEERKKKLLLRKEYNKKADYLISELQNYRISLPDIEFNNPEQGGMGNKAARSLKRYPKSPFYDRIEQDEIKKKREEYLKEYEKKKVRERQQVYGKKVRRSLKDSSVFVTD